MSTPTTTRSTTTAPISGRRRRSVRRSSPTVTLGRDEYFDAFAPASGGARQQTWFFPSPAEFDELAAALAGSSTSTLTDATQLGEDGQRRCYIDSKFDVVEVPLDDGSEAYHPRRRGEPQRRPFRNWFRGLFLGLAVVVGAKAFATRA